MQFLSLPISWLGVRLLIPMLLLLPMTVQESVAQGYAIRDMLLYADEDAVPDDPELTKLALGQEFLLTLALIENGRAASVTPQPPGTLRVDLGGAILEQVVSQPYGPGFTFCPAEFEDETGIWTVTCGWDEIDGVGSTTIMQFWLSVPGSFSENEFTVSAVVDPFDNELAEPFVFGEEMIEQTFKISRTVINSTADVSDGDLSDGVCDTGGTISRDGEDEPECTLRAAIEQANNDGGTQSKTYDIPTSDAGYQAATGQFRITPGSPLPPVMTEFALSGGVAGAGKSIPRPAIIVDGQGLVFGAGSDGSLLTGHAVVRSPGPGIEIQADGVTISSCAVGTDGFDAGGLGNQMDGILILGQNNTIGGAEPDLGNQVSGNVGAGIKVFGHGNTIQFNLIGVNSSADGPLPNSEDGILIEDANNNSVGNAEGQAGNTIAHNTRDGVRIIGSASGNEIVANSIFENGELGIDLRGDGVSLPDEADSDEGPNEGQNFPVITYRSAGDDVTTVEGFLESAATTVFDLDFYSNDSADNSGYGEADTFVQRVQVETDGIGRADFTLDLPGAHGRIVATATDPDGNTSELSKAPLMINTIVDDADLSAIDGECNTGSMVGASKSCSLRGALQESNRIQGPDYVVFDIPSAGPHSILVSSPLPSVLEETELDGSRQTGYSSETSVLDVVGPASGADGLTILAENARVQGITVRDFAGHGIRFTGAGELVLANVWVARNGRDGLNAESDIRIESLPDQETDGIVATANGESGVAVLNGSTLLATARLKATLNGSNYTRPVCPDIAGIHVVGSLEASDIDASDNCGHGVNVRFDISQLGDATLDGNLRIVDNERTGIRIDATLDISGGPVEISRNHLEGIRALGRVTLASNGESENEPLIQFEENGHVALDADGDILISSPSLFRGNGFEEPGSGCTKSKLGTIESRSGAVTTVVIEVVENCASGILAHNDIRISGNATVTDNGGIAGIWGDKSIYLVGEEHDVSRNGRNAIYSSDAGRTPADGNIAVSGQLTASGNGTSVSEGDCMVSSNPGEEAALTTFGAIRLEDVDISDNCYSGIQTHSQVEITGDSRIVGNTGAGIVARDPGLFLTGAQHEISDNGLAGIAVFGSGSGTTNVVRVTGQLLLARNHSYHRSNDSSGCLPESGNAGLWAGFSRIELDTVTIEDNCGSGLIGWDVIVAGSALFNSNLGHGILHQGMLEMNAAEICYNGGYGVRGGSVNLGPIKICSNGYGGVRLGEDAAAKGSSGQRTVRTSSRIVGTALLENEGPGVRAENYPLVISGASLIGNIGGGVLMATDAPSIVATDSWWGDASGPGGAGPGSGDAIGPNVDVPDWRSAPPVLSISAVPDTLFLEEGRSGRLRFAVRNWSGSNDMVEVNIDDPDSWLSGTLDVMMDLGPDQVEFVDREITVPPGKGFSNSQITVTASPTGQPEIVETDSIVVFSYLPAATSLTVEPDTLDIAPMGSGQFVAFVRDQGGFPLSADIEWGATGGAITPSGLYTAGEIEGEFAVTASDPISGISGSAVVHVVSSTETDAVHDPAGLLDAGHVFPNPLTVSTTLRLELPRSGDIQIDMYNILGQRVRRLSSGPMPRGQHTIRIEKGDLGAGLYFVWIRLGDQQISRPLLISD